MREVFTASVYVKIKKHFFELRDPKTDISSEKNQFPKLGLIAITTIVIK